MPALSRLGQTRYGPHGGRHRFIATADSTANAFCAMEIVDAPGGGPPLHCHSREDEFFYVVEGRFVIDLEGRTVELTPRQGFTVPKGVMHRTRAPERSVILMIEGAGVVPTGDK